MSASQITYQSSSSSSSLYRNRSHVHRRSYDIVNRKISEKNRKVDIIPQSITTISNDDDDDDKNRLVVNDNKQKEQKENFWNVFLTDAIEVSGNGVPRIKRYNKERNESEKSPTTTNTSSNKNETSEIKGNGFFQRLTIIGLIVSICFIVSAIQVTHFQTLKWVLFNPLEVMTNSDVSREISRRLLAPFVRLLAAWFYARWRVRWALGFSVLSFIAPAIDFD